MGPTIRLFAALGLAAAACVGAGDTAFPPAWADGPGPAPRLRAVRAALRSQDDQARTDAFLKLDALLPALDPAAQRDLVPLLVDVLARRSPSDGARAVRVLARMPGDKARVAWLGALGGAHHPAVFQAALDAVVDRRSDPESVRQLLRRARDERASRTDRALALEALGLLDCGPARLVLARAATPLGPEGREDWLLASGRALGLGRRGGEDGLEPLVELLEHPHAAPRVHAWEGLRTLTGARLPPDAGAWRRLLRSRADPAVPVPAPPPSSPEDRYRQEKPQHVPRYYGIPVAKPRSHVVFCLDVSQSMYGRGIDTARRQLHDVLTAFPTSYAFDVVAFNERVMPFAGELWPAHPVVKARVLDWIDALETISYTNLFDAVETAFGLGGLGPRTATHPRHLDAVFLLSDGAPNRGRVRDEDRIVEALAALSRGRLPIHCIAAGEEVFPLLRRIADATGGRFVDAFLFD